VLAGRSREVVRRRGRVLWGRRRRNGRGSTFDLCDFPLEYNYHTNRRASVRLCNSAAARYPKRKQILYRYVLECKSKIWNANLSEHETDGYNLTNTPSNHPIWEQGCVIVSKADCYVIIKNFIVLLFIHSSLAPQSFVGPWPLFQFRNPVHSR
jgi:hypothetical protein